MIVILKEFKSMIIEKKTDESYSFLIHPGETISDIIVERGISLKNLAASAGVSEKLLQDVVDGKDAISNDLAMAMEKALGIPGSFWLNLQANFDSNI